MIGILYFINNNEYIIHHPIYGFKVIHSIDNIDKNIIWISNLKDIKFENIKKEDFFNIKFKEIIYFFNIDKLNAPEQFKVISKLFNAVVEIFKEEYSFLNLKVDELKKIDNFSDIFFKSKIKHDLIKNEEILEKIDNNFNKKIELKKFVHNNFFVSYFQSYDFIKSLFEINFPFGEYEILDSKDFSKSDDPFIVINSIQKDTCFFMQCEIENSKFMELFFPEKNNDSWFSSLELSFLKNKCNLKFKKIIIFKNNFKLKDVIRTRLKNNYFNFAFEVFSLNLIKSIKNNNINLINLWLESYEKIYFLNKSLYLMEKDVEIVYFSGNKVLIGIDNINQIELLEKNNLMYPVKLVRYILNN